MRLADSVFAHVSAAQMAGMGASGLSGISAAKMAILEEQVNGVSACSGIRTLEDLQVSFKGQGTQQGTSNSEESRPPTGGLLALWRTCTHSNTRSSMGVCVCVRVLCACCCLLCAADTCSGIGPKCFAALSPSAFVEVQGYCLSIVPTDTFSHASAAQLAAFGMSAVQGITAGQMGSLGPQCSALVGAQLHVLNALRFHTCAALTPACAAALNASVIPSLALLCSRQIAPAAMAALSVQQAVGVPQLWYFTNEQLAAMWAVHGEQLARMEPARQRPAVRQDGGVSGQRH